MPGAIRPGRVDDDGKIRNSPGTGSSTASRTRSPNVEAGGGSQSLVEDRRKAGRDVAVTRQVAGPDVGRGLGWRQGGCRYGLRGFSRFQLRPGQRRQAVPHIVKRRLVLPH
jgi:hypothetical protein